MDLEFHPIANCWRLVEGERFSELVADIKENGLREPIVLFDDKILDGRNRYRACLAAGVDPHFVAYGSPLDSRIEWESWEGGEFGRETRGTLTIEGESTDYDCEPDFIQAEYKGDLDDPIAFAKSVNEMRRHDDESQRAMTAAKLATLPRGRPAENSPMGLNIPSQEEAAAIMDVGLNSVKRARVVIDKGAIELRDAVEKGGVSVRAAADIASAYANDKLKQAEIVARGEKEILEAAKHIRAEKAAAATQKRIERIEEISRGNAQLGTSVKYPVIYADPPWRYELPPLGGSNRSIENHYPTMSLEEICALPVNDLATEDAILYMWATSPKLAECFKVIEAWGFEYRTNFVWVKDKIGMGYHNRNQHELLLVCKRGEIPPPPIEARVSSVVNADRGDHSVKPIAFYELIESFYPTLPRIELFCRSPRDGWSVWGNQSSGDA